jgi:hypothetical protein
MPSYMMLFALAVHQRFRIGVPLRHVLRTDRPLPLPKENPRFVYVYDYISWDAMKSVDTLKAKLEWKHPDDRDVRFDCDIHGLGNYESLRRKGISADGELFCRFVREGKLTREEALRRENKIAETARAECIRLIESLGLGQDERGLW